MSELVEFERSGVEESIGIARLIREKPLNSLLLDTIDELASQIYPWLEDDLVNCIVLDSSSDRAFCAGADITALYHAIREGNLDYADAFFSHEYRLDYALHTAAKPLVVWGNGIVMGGGLGLLGGCSHRIGTPATKIAMPEITIGLFPDAGGTWFLSQLPDHLGLFAGLTGCQLAAGDGLELGLLDYVVEADCKADLMADLEAVEWQGELQVHHQQVSEVIERYQVSEALMQNLEGAREAIVSLMNKCVASDNFLSAFEAGLEDLPDDDWLKQAADTYRNGSSTTAGIFVEQMKRAEGMSLADMFRLELIIACQCARHHDFPEGVRALLVDKDRDPKWMYPSAAALPANYLAEFFEPVWTGEHPLSDLAR
jgi:enoyl-CoA hydratase/carnithine racemase